MTSFMAVLIQHTLAMTASMVDLVMISSMAEPVTIALTAIQLVAQNMTLWLVVMVLILSFLAVPGVFHTNPLWF